MDSDGEMIGRVSLSLQSGLLLMTYTCHCVKVRGSVDTLYNEHMDIC